MNNYEPVEFEYSEGNITERDELKQAGIMAYSVFENILSPEDWKTMLGNLQDDAAFDKLLTQAKPFVCKHNNNIVGVVYVVPNGNQTTIFQNDWAYIRKLGIVPKYRCHGIAHTLMQKCVDCAKQSNEKTLALHTSEFQQAWRIYERLGFRYIKDAGKFYGHTYWLYTINL